MSRINTNVTSLIAQRSLAQTPGQLNTSLQRLSTGLKINSGNDDPAGLIASENLKNQQAGLSRPSTTPARPATSSAPPRAASTRSAAC